MPAMKTKQPIKKGLGRPHVQRPKRHALLKFVARVENGLVPRLRDEISSLFKKHATSVCRFANLPETKASRWGQLLDAAKMEECRWLKPVLVYQVAFTAWTSGGKLRHGTFIAMRDER
jgi:bifunctional non-homologous end joining protein LigD